MSSEMMHVNEVYTDELLVSWLVRKQFPQWADLPITQLKSTGTDNALYRLGDEMVVRLPRIDWAVEMIAKEQQWLPELAPHLPLTVPTLVGKGEPVEAYPWHWSIYAWLDGDMATLKRIDDVEQMARDLAQFIRALQEIDATGGPAPGSHNVWRGVRLADRDARTREAIDSLHGMIDTKAALAAWEAALDVPVWHKPRLWIHGDLQSGNLLARDGRLSAVIDFGCLAVGDPACDLQVAWNLFTGEARAVFREALGVDDMTWARGRGWALSVGLLQLPYYHQTNPLLATIARRTINEVLAEHANGV